MEPQLLPYMADWLTKERYSIKIVELDTPKQRLIVVDNGGPARWDKVQYVTSDIGLFEKRVSYFLSINPHLTGRLNYVRIYEKSRRKGV